MPWYVNSMANSNGTACYNWSIRYRNFPDYPYVLEWVKEHRAQASRDANHSSDLKKELRDKFFKEEERYHLRLQRACNLIINYIEGNPGWTCSSYWPEELAPALDEITGRIEVREWYEEPTLKYLQERRKASVYIWHNGGAIR